MIVQIYLDQAWAVHLDAPPIFVQEGAHPVATVSDGAAVISSIIDS